MYCAIRSYRVFFFEKKNLLAASECETRESCFAMFASLSGVATNRCPDIAAACIIKNINRAFIEP